MTDTEEIDEVHDDCEDDTGLVLGVGIGTARILEVCGDATGGSTEYDRVDIGATEICETGTEFSSASVLCGGQ